MNPAEASPAGGDCVVQYLYVHDQDERFTYPTSRAHGGAANTAMRYLECALVQAASLLLRPDPGCEVVLVTNLRDLRDESAVERRGVRLLAAMEKLGVRMEYAAYDHRNRVPIESYASSRYLLDAILAVVDDARPDRRYWFTDVDCVWLDPAKMLGRAPAAGSIGCVLIPYPPEWDIEGTSPRRLGEFGGTLGSCPVPVPWVGGELICGRGADLSSMVAACDALDDEVGASDAEIPAEEHLLSLAGGLGRVDFADLSAVAWRVLTGPRHLAEPHPDPGELGLWHLPSEKGLSFRRTASALLRASGGRLRRDFEEPGRAMRRFNVEGTGIGRRLRDDGWLAAHRLRRALPSRAA